MSDILRLPFYAKASLTLLGLFLFVTILSITQDIILPVLYAILVAILINPLVQYLLKKKIPRVLAIGGVLLIAMVLITSLIIFLFSQISRFSDALPQLIEKFDVLINHLIALVSESFNISTTKINQMVADTKENALSNSGTAIGTTLSTIGGALATIFLTPVYIFMILYYQSHLIAFIYKVFGAHHSAQVNDFFTETKTIIQSYLLGLFLEFAIIAALNSLGLLVIGLEYAILFGVLGALLNIIPYVGGLIAVGLFMIIALVSKPPEYALYVFIMYFVIQLIDNNYIVPKIIGSKVKLNAFVSILAVICGAALWGIPGMFLSIPMIAIIKIIFERIDALKHWGFLLSDT